MNGVRIFALLALAGCAKTETRSVAAVGSAAPNYSATRLEGGSTSLAALKGKVVLLNVWATWCAPCREEIPYLQSLYTTHAADGFEVVGVSVDARGSEASVASFRDEFGMTYPIWLDPDEGVQTLFLALGVPASYLIDRRGVMQWKHLGTVKANDTSFTRALTESLRSTP